jgi:hypothetical protein
MPRTTTTTKLSLEPVELRLQLKNLLCQSDRPVGQNLIFAGAIQTILKFVPDWPRRQVAARPRPQMTASVSPMSNIFLTLCLLLIEAKVLETFLQFFFSKLVCLLLFKKQWIEKSSRCTNKLSLSIKKSPKCE